jgi:SNF2 family DNA or RNA helicase
MSGRLRTRLYHFQKQGVQFLEEHQGRALLGDDMGLGKTLQTIAWMVHHPEARPAVILCPATLKHHWQRQLRMHGRLRSTVISGRPPRLLRTDIWIVNYDIVAPQKRKKGALPGWGEFLKEHNPKLLVLDECHYVKERTTKRTKMCLTMAKGVPHIIALSGTPITNRPVEFYPVLSMIAPGLFPSFWKYAMKYCDPKRGFRGRGWDFRGASHLDELHEVLKPVMLRRMKTDVLPDLPPKIRTTLPVDIDNMGEYHAARDDFIKWLMTRIGADAAYRAIGAIAMVRLEKLKQLAAQGKLASARTWIDDWMDETGQKLVVYATHKSIASALKTSYRDISVVITGDTPVPTRQYLVDRFQSDPRCRMLIGNIKAAGTGLTLTAASTVLFLELGWTPAEHDQAEDRVLRIGQEASTMNAYYMIGVGTVEEDVLELLERKRDVVSRVLNGKAAEADILNDLLKRIRSGNDKSED